jgi:O-antigen/teichoic acid export membrane protein
MIGPTNYGLWGYGFSIAAYATIVLSPGLLTWGVRAVARDPSHAGKILVIVNGAQLVLAVAGYGGLILYAHGVLADPAKRLIVLCCGLILFTMALSADWVLNGLELTRYPAAIGVGGACLNVIALLTLVHSPRDVYAFALIPAGVATAMTAVIYIILVKKARIRFELPTLRETRDTLMTSLPLGGTMALVIIFHYANNLIVQTYLGIAALGIFWAAYRLLDLATQIPALLITVYLPRLTRFAGSNSVVARREALVFARVHMVIGFFLAAYTCAEAPAIIGVLYGSKYAGAAPLLRIMSIAMLFLFAICGYNNCLLAFGKDWVMLRAVIANTLVTIGGGLWLVPRRGLWGAALVVACTDLTGWLVSLPYYRKTIGAIQFSAWIRPLLGAACIVGSCFLMQALRWPVWVRVPISALTYIPFVFEDIRSVLNDYVARATASP